MNNPKILIVDNDISTVETIKAAFATETYSLDIAYGGQEALEKMRKEDGSYDLLILDLMMPEVDGIQVLKKLMTEDGKLKKIPVLVVSALPVKSKAFQESQEKFDELSVVKGVIEKPFEIDELLAKTKVIVGE